MNAFADKHVATAIARLPKMPSDQVKSLRDTARVKGLDSLFSACEAELAKRPFSFTADNAARFEQMAVAVGDMSLVEAMRFAFSKEMTANPDEARILRWIAANPGGTYEDALKAYGKGDLSLVIGHLVYHRYGCFRRFVDPGEDQSSVLLRKDRTQGSVRYWLKPEAEAIFRELGII